MAALFTIDTGIVQNAQIDPATKAVLRSIVDTLNGAVDVSATEADLAKLAAVTASSDELNFNDGPTAGVATASKTAVLGASKNLDILGLPVGGLKIGTAGSEVAVDASAAELNYNDIATLGTGAASKSVVLDANGRYRAPSTGTLFNAGKETKAQAAPAAKTVTAGITAAELVAGLITTTGASAPSSHQLPTGTEIDAAFPGIATGDSFEFVIINTGVGAGDDATIAVNTDVTIVGNPTVGSIPDVTEKSGSGVFIARRSAANAYVVYRKS